MIEAGEQALRAGDSPAPCRISARRTSCRDQLDVLTQQRLQGHLQMLSVESADGDPSESLPAPDGELLDSAAAGQSVAARQLSAEIGKRQSRGGPRARAGPQPVALASCAKPASWSKSRRSTRR